MFGEFSITDSNIERVQPHPSWDHRDVLEKIKIIIIYIIEVYSHTNNRMHPGFFFQDRPVSVISGIMGVLQRNVCRSIVPPTGVMGIPYLPM